MIHSPYYWAFVAAITLVFSAVDVEALRSGNVRRFHGLAVAGYVTSWVIIGGLSLPVAPLGSLWWVFPWAIRIAVTVMFGGGQLLAALFRAEQGVVHPELRQAKRTWPKRKLSEAEIRTAEAYDAEWQKAERRRNHELGLDEHI